MKKTYSSLILLLTALIWGLAFVSQSEASGVVGPLGYNGLRMILGSVVLIPLFIRETRGKDSRYFRSLFRDGAICGLLLGCASFFQQWGIEYTSAGKAGFITSLYILIVPVVSLFLGKRNSGRTWICVLTGLVGAFLLSVSGSEGIGKGDALVFVCAVIFALHVLTIDRVGKKYSGPELSCVQFFTAGVGAFILSLIFEDNTVNEIHSALVPILYGGIGSCGIAYTLQIIGQKDTPPTKATLILSLESVFSAIGGALILHERMETREIIGCVILFVSVLIAQLPEKSNPSSR